MDRSTFLRIMSLAGIGSTLRIPALGSDKQTRGKVLVVGAGVSGIAAARTLSANNWEVQVIEARDRIGGRIWSDASLGKPVDMGASWIHEASGNPITKLSREFGIKTIETNWESVSLYNYQGKKFSDREVEEILEEGDWIGKKALRLINRQDTDKSVGWGISRVLKDQGYTGEELTAINWRIATQELDAAIEYDKLSGWGDKEDGFFGGDLIFPDGYGQVVQRLAEDLEIILEQPVKKVESLKDGVKITTNQKSYEADFAIVTLPLGVLKSGALEFVPSLPPNKQKAIDQLGMGNLNKLAVKFSEITWPTNSHFIGYVSRTKGEFPVFVNWAHYINQPYLLGTIGNSFSRRLDKLSTDAITNKLRTCFNTAWKQDVTIEAIKYSGWARDPYAGGSYSYLPVGVDGKMFDTLAQPAGRIHFAGEATNRGMNATVHGAYLSGLREAQAIIDK